MVLDPRTMSLVTLVVLGLVVNQVPSVEANPYVKGGAHQQSICEEGSTWEEECNTCSCSNGRSVCTLMACLPPQQVDTDECTEGQSKPHDDGCNTCRCVNGVYACTRKACQRIPDQVDGCTEGHSKPSDDGCNTCKCVNGVYACTRRACPDQVDGCTEGHSKPSDDGCNTCTCENGRYACTERGCSPQQVDQCPDGPERPSEDGCNTCACTGNGRYDRCTEKACLPIQQDDRCPKGDSYFDGCNTCTCNGKGGYACTEKFCLDQVIDQDRCPDGESYFDGCNTCTCDGNGRYICTERFCPDQGIDQVANCPYGPTKLSEDGCNTCTCTGRGGYACTEKACEVPADGCTNGDTKKADDGCNTCKCVNGRFACTKMTCRPEVAAAWRDDFKCGPDHLAPNNQPAQCDPHGKYPCCSNKGWCGHTSYHCECTDCVDHKEIKCPDGLSRASDDGCNTCFCDGNGGYDACTEMHCIKQVVAPKKG